MPDCALNTSCYFAKVVATVNQQTCQRVKDILRDFVQQTAQQARQQDYSLEELKQEYPFQSLFFRDEALVAFKYQRSIVTKLGQRLYPRLVEAIAQERYRHIYRDYRLSVTLDSNWWQTIDQIVSELRMASRKPDHQRELNTILVTPSSGREEERLIVLDIFLADFSPGPLYLELKTLKPNLDICDEAKRKILAFEAFMHSEGQPVMVVEYKLQRPNRQAKGFLAFPYGIRNRYTHHFTQRVMDMSQEVLIGAELWDLLGGDGTFEQLLAIVDEVRRETPLL
jgi:hypothetical protein